MHHQWCPKSKRMKSAREQLRVVLKGFYLKMKQLQKWPNFKKAYCCVAWR